ncbi:DNRLRE domain-containing protein [Streptosporangium sp. DT93]|uniref:DNRLRE domain-containing protein n=1 Tax=Streptosporangium sp. DT93 TaxID=3393428 RepID=UPI003CE8F612
MLVAGLPAYPALPAAAALTAPLAQPSPLLTALYAAQKQQVPMEIESERTERSTSWALPNGLVRTELSSGPERVKRNGAWVPIDTTLEQHGSVFKPRVAKADIEISAGGEAAVAKLKHSPYRSFGVRWAEKLPVPIVQGNTATYRNVVHGGDLVVTALPTGITHDVVLRERPSSPLRIPMPLDLIGIKFAKDKHGRLRLNDNFNSLLASAPAPQMWDAAADTSPDAGRRMQVDTEVIQEQGKQVLVLKPNAAFLNDPATQYPVTIDPWTTLAIKTDTFVSSDYTTGQSASTWLHAGKFGSGAKTARSYLKFETAPILGSRIVNADLRMWNYKSNTCGTSVGSGIQVRRVTSFWKSADLTLTSQPPTTSEDAVTLKAAAGDPDCASGELFYSIEGITQDWADGKPGYGVQLRAASETDASNWRMYYSSENSDTAHRPKLVVDHEPRATDVSLSGGTVNLRWGGQSGATAYLLYDDNESVEVWRGEATSVNLPIQAPAYRSLIAKAVTATGIKDIAKFLITVPAADSDQAPVLVATNTTNSIIDWQQPDGGDPAAEEEYRFTDPTQTETILPEPIAYAATKLGESGSYQMESGPIIPDGQDPGSFPVDVEPTVDPPADESGDGNGESDPYTPPVPEEVSTEPANLAYGVEITPEAAPEPETQPAMEQRSGTTTSGATATSSAARAAKRIVRSWTTYENYIPWGWIDGPEIIGQWVTCQTGADWWYTGDGRGAGFNTGKYRTRAAVKYDWSNRRNTTYKHIRSTNRYKRLSNGSMQFNARKTASGSKFHVRSLSNTGRYGRVVIEHSVNDPFCSSLADVTYANQQDMYQNGKHWLYGSHDKMPTHEMYRQDIYSDGTSSVRKIFTHKLKKPTCLVSAVPGCGTWRYQYVR